MFSQTDIEQRCALCNNTSFYTENGFFFCSTCQTQNENIREEVYEVQYDSTVRLRKIKIKKDKSGKEGAVIGWTSWELYNLVLIGLTNELIQIGADPCIKLTVLQLWTFYLSNLEVAFVSKTQKLIPKLARRYHKRDADILFGRISSKKKIKKKNRSSNTSASLISSSQMSSKSASARELNKHKKLLQASEYDKYLQTQACSDSDGFSFLNESLQSLKSSRSNASSTAIKIHFNKKAKLETKKIRKMSKKIPYAKRMNYKKNHITTQYAIGPDVITPAKLWSILYLALRINNQNIYLSDMLRFGREGHLSYYKLNHLLPAEVLLTKSDSNFLTQYVAVTHKGLRRTACYLAKFLHVLKLEKPDFLCLIKRYCDDLHLPRGIFLYAKRLYLAYPSIMNFSQKSALIPNYEGRAMAYIIVVLKTLFGLDDITEKQVSRLIEKLNRIASEQQILTAKLFSFCEWQQYIECRKCVLVHLHFPSKIKYDPECVGTSHLYLRFLGEMQSKHEVEPPVITNYKHIISPNLANALQHCIERLNDNSIGTKNAELFPPSLTPLQSYINSLLENEQNDLPNILRINFYDSKVGYMTKPESLIELASQCGINLKIIDRSLHYLEKFVPPFEQPRMPSVQELSELVKVIIPKTNKIIAEKTYECLLDYAHRNRICKLKLNFENLNYFSLIHNKFPEFDETLDLEEDSYFDYILPDGRLNISETIDSEDEIVLDDSKNEKIQWIDNSCLLNKKFTDKYNIKLYNHEINSLMKLKVPKKKLPYRDSKGKFTTVSTRSSKKNNETPVKNKFKKIIHISSNESSEDEHAPKNEAKKEAEVIDVPDCPSVDLADSDSSIIEDHKNDITRDKHFEKISDNKNEVLFRPYKHYWMYHCIFSRVKRKNFELFEKELPENFLWLLNECADIIEMTTEDLYEEVCIIEALHLNIIKSQNSKNNSDYSFYDCTSTSYKNNILKKW